jgi:hypothetical protein
MHLKNVKKWPSPLFRPKTNHTFNQKPNPSRKTVPLSAHVSRSFSKVLHLSRILRCLSSIMIQTIVRWR